METKARTKKPWFNQMSALIRWVHIYLSLFGFAVILFFSVTGITLNHPTWFGGEAERTEQLTGEMQTAWLADPMASTRPVEETPSEFEIKDKLAVVEFLRQKHKLSGAVSEFRIDETECIVAFKGPGFSADAFIARDSGKYELSVARMGMVALVNDLHKGRDSGTAWSWLIDVSAVLMAISSVTGLLLICFIRRKRFTGLVVAFAGFLITLGWFIWLVP